MGMKRAKVTSVPESPYDLQLPQPGGEPEMTKPKNLGGSFALPGTAMTLNRMGYGAMQLAGPGVWGPPRDVDMAIAVLKEAIAGG